VKSPIQRRAAIAALFLAPTLAACGFSAQTDQVYQAAAGVNDRSGDVEILNAQVVSAEDGTGTFVATFDNNTDTADRLVSVTGGGVTATSDGVVIPADGVANLAEPAETGSPVQVQLDGDAVRAGGWIRLTFVFANGQSTKLLVPVVANSEDYHDVPLPSGPAATSTPSAG